MNKFMLKILSPISECEARMKSPLALAYIGDTIYDLYYRVNEVKNSNANVNNLNSNVIKKVNAKAQSHAIEEILDKLTEEECAIYQRGRNAKSATTPKNMSMADYRRATGLEALFGFLYLTGQYERIEELMECIMAAEHEDTAAES